MSDRRWTVVVAVALATVLTIGFAQGADDKKYPDWRGQWARFVVPGLPGQPSHAAERGLKARGALPI